MAHKSGEVTNAAVLEIGRHTTKLGYAGEDSPRAFFSSVVAAAADEIDEHAKASKNKSSKGKSDGLKLKFNPLELVNNSHSNSCENMELKTAIGASGLVEDWDVWLAILKYAGRVSGMNPNHSVRNSTANNNDDDDTFLFEDMPLVLVEKPHNSSQNRAKMLDLVFESTDAPAAFLAKDAVLDCFACGRTTGIVADMGDTTLVTPVYEGWAEVKGMMRGIGVDAIQDKMLSRMDDLFRAEIAKKGLEGPSNLNTSTTPTSMKEAMPQYQVRESNHVKYSHPFHQLARQEMAIRCLEHFSPHCIAEYGYIANNFKHIPKIPYTLPDGTEIQFGNERFEVGELLFGDDGSRGREKCATKFSQQVENCQQPSKPQSIDFFTGALQNMICESAFRCDREQQAQLLGNVVLAGGGACFENIVDRMRAEVEAVIHTHTPGWRVKVLSPPITERAYCAWLGGSILGSLGSFGEIYISKAEYQECGSSIVYRKCP